MHVLLAANHWSKCPSFSCRALDIGPIPLTGMSAGDRFRLPHDTAVQAGWRDIKRRCYFHVGRYCRFVITNPGQVPREVSQYKIDLEPSSFRVAVTPSSSLVPFTTSPLNAADHQVETARANLQESAL